MAPKARTIAGKLVPRGSEEREFDRAFWRAISGPERLAMLWDLVLEARAWQGADGDPPRLQ
jgi:hypothetical protein